MKKKLTNLANVAIICAALLVGYMVIMERVSTGNHNAHPSPTSALVGKSVPKALHLSTDRDSLVLVLSAGCPYCSQSSHFYKELSQRAHEHKKDVAAFLPQSKDVGIAYLKELGVSVDTVQQVDLFELGVHSTPTVLVVSPLGVIRNAWIGKLPDNTEKMVFATIEN